MEKARPLESLLRLPPSHEVVADCLVLTCGCLVSESAFAQSASTSCPVCSAAGVTLLAPVAPLRTLYQLLAEGSRRSLSKRDDREGASLLSLFYTFAKEEADQPTDASESAIAIPPRPERAIPPRPEQAAGAAGSPLEFSISPLTHSVMPAPPAAPPPPPSSADEQREYNFSKCFPFYRKALAFATHSPKLLLLKKSPKYIASDIHSFTDATGAEVTRFVLLLESRWLLYQYKAGRPALVSCGRLTGEYGALPAAVAPPLAADTAHEVVVRNDFGEEAAVDDTRRRLAQWDHVHCALSANYLLVAGTRGVMRVLALSGRPLYTYVTDFPIRCVAVAPDESVAACGITARERLLGKEQPFIILHRLAMAPASAEAPGAAPGFAARDPSGLSGGLGPIEPVTISGPYRDPIKLMRFSALSRHLLCSTVWEARLFIIRLTSGGGDYRKPRLIWLDSLRQRQLVDAHGDEMGEEGLTDVQFDQLHPTLVIATWCLLTPRPPVVIRLDGVHMEGARHALVGSALADGASAASTGSHADDERQATSLETIMRVSEVGSAIHRFALLPRGDGVCFVDREGRLYLVSTPNFQLHPSLPMKRVVVQLGEAANAERYQEAASVRFAPDGAKIYVVDRKGLFQVFDFGKGVPGHDGDVVKCKIVM